MAFTAATLAQANAGATSTTVPNLWLYKTGDNITDLDAANYWAGAYRKIAAGDIVIAGCADGGVILTVSAISATTSTAAIFA